jgi:glycosyltransferase involved in cell wall biosynthesis
VNAERPVKRGALVVLDADVLGRQRTGDETYVRNLLRELEALQPPLELAAVTRRPDLVPPPVRAVRLGARNQPLRMAVHLPLLLRRLQPALAHFLYVVPPAYRGPAVVTVQDLSFERHPELMGARDRFFFRTFVRPSVRRAARVLTGSEWTKRDLVERYGVDPAKVLVTPYGVDPLFGPDGPAADGAPYALFVGGLERRKNPLAALEAIALTDAGLRLVVAGPDKGGRSDLDRAIARLRLEGRVELCGHVGLEELAALYRGASCLVFPSRYEGFGLPVLEAMASGTPVVATTASSVPEVAGDAAILVDPGDPVALASGIERAIADRERLRAAGLERARSYTWTETARRTLEVYRELL